MDSDLRVRNRRSFASIAEVEEDLLADNGYRPTGRASLEGDPIYAAPRAGLECPRPTALLLIAEATLGDLDPSGLRRPRGEERGDHHQEHRGHEDEAVHAVSIGASRVGVESCPRGGS